MAESPARRRRAQPQLKLPGPLAATLRQILDERGLSARGLSLAAGLAGDTVRNALSGRSRTTRPEALEALASYLGITVAALQGREPLPPPPSPGAPHVSAGSARVPEVEYVPRGETPHPAADLERREVGGWVMPTDVLSESGGTPGGLVLVRAPLRAVSISDGVSGRPSASAGRYGWLRLRRRLRQGYRSGRARVATQEAP